MDLDPKTEQTLADMSDEDWSALAARVRPPTSSEQLKTVAAKVISDPDQLNAFMSVANAKAFAGENGDIDEDKVMGHLTALFAAGQQQPGPRQWGQGSAPGGPGARAGEGGRRALAARHGVGADANHQPAAGAGIRPGAAGRQAAARRHGTKGRK